MLIDTTLREGEQRFGVYFDLETKKQLIKGLVEFGLEEIELGTISLDENSELAQLVQLTKILSSKTSTSIWSPCREEYIRLVAKLGVDRINIGVPVSDNHIKKRLKLSRDSLLKQLRAVLTTASKVGIKYISIGLEDLCRADFNFALKVARTAIESGAKRIRLSDTVGILSPMEISDLVRKFKSTLSSHIAVHCHNDFGQATANAITAILSGADFVDVSVLGLGERAGIAALEEVAAYLYFRKKANHYNMSIIRDLSKLVSKATKVPISESKPIVGGSIFACESGLHVHGINIDPMLFEPFAPETVGAKRKIGLGKKSGRAAVLGALKQIGISDPSFCLEQAASNLVATVRNLSRKQGRPLSEAELKTLVQQFHA
ncbi:LeuA family protein [Desulfovulcanus sp.]